MENFGGTESYNHEQAMRNQNLRSGAARPAGDPVSRPGIHDLISGISEKVSHAMQLSVEIESRFGSVLHGGGTLTAGTQARTNPPEPSQVLDKLQMIGEALGVLNEQLIQTIKRCAL